MVVKELDSFTGSDLRAQAGRKAEEQMAFYLRRAFEGDPHVFVFNNLRLERTDSTGRTDAAQIDHLLFHRNGMVIIESKSVSGRMRVNEHGEFTRIWDGRPQGIQSPIQQARLQADFLRSYLRDHAPQLLNKVLGITGVKLGRVQGGFGALPIDLLVAISDGGIIERVGAADPTELCKADQVPERIRALVGEHRRLANPLLNLTSDMGRTLSAEEMERTRDFLLTQHRPLRMAPAPKQAPVVTPVAATPTPPPRRSPAAPTPPRPLPSRPAPAPAVVAAAVLSKTAAASPAPLGSFACRHCKRMGPGVLRMEWGRHSYYFKCCFCDGNTPVDTALNHCPACNERTRIRKSGPNFYLECPACRETSGANASRLLFTNPPDN